MTFIIEPVKLSNNKPSQESSQLLTADYATKIETLTNEEKEKYLALASKLDYHNMSSLQVYGADLNNIISKTGDNLLSSVQSNNSVEVIGYVNDVLAELSSFDEDLNRYTNTHSNPLKRFFYSLPFVKKVATSLENVMNNYNTVATNIDKITHKISNAKVVALRDNTTLQTIFDNNVLYIQQIRELIIGAKLKLAEFEDKLSEVMKSSDVESWEISDLTDFTHKLSKRIADLQTTEYVLSQNLLQIRATQNNNIAIVEKTDNIVNQVIPIWKNQLPIAIILKNQSASIEAQNKISETTNKLIAKTANDLKVNSISVAKASEEAVISIDTLKSATQDLITTINEVQKIHKDGETARANLENTLQELGKQIIESVKNV